MVYSVSDIGTIFESNFHQRVTSQALIEHGTMTYKYEVALGERLYMLRVYPNSRECVAKREHDILLRANTIAAKAPKICCTSDHNNYAYIIYEKIPGDMLNFSLLTRYHKEKVAAQVVANIFELAQMQYESYGNLTEDEPSYVSWKAFLKANMEEGLGYLEQSQLISKGPYEEIKTFMAGEIKKIPEPAPGFVWSDFSQENIIVLDNELMGFIDFEGAFAGDPILSLGYLYAVEGGSEFFKHIFAEFKKRYSVDMPRVMFYAFFRLLRIIKYKQAAMPAGGKRHSFFDYFKGLAFAVESIGETTGKAVPSSGRGAPGRAMAGRG
jgi:aminoglycoside phosphotransferase (APT) family kinase protein